MEEGRVGKTEEVMIGRCGGRFKRHWDQTFGEIKNRTEVRQALALHGLRMSMKMIGLTCRLQILLIENYISANVKTKQFNFSYKNNYFV